METLKIIASRLSPEAARAIEGAEGLCEIRLRARQPVQLRDGRGARFVGGPLPPGTLQKILAQLMDFSVYARENELKEGYFTAADGCRVGVCGRAVMDGDRVACLRDVSSLCVRLAQEPRGCADALLPRLLVEDGAGIRVRSLLIVSPPGLGKTTLLRELARALSTRGLCVAIADERHEIAACASSAPTRDVGSAADVIDGCPKRVAIAMLLRAMAPEVIVTDEIGDERDAQALLDARRCGAAILASAHGEGMAALRRRGLREALRGGAFDLAALLGPGRGEIARIVPVGMGKKEDGRGAENPVVRLRRGRGHAVRPGAGRRNPAACRAAQ